MALPNTLVNSNYTQKHIVDADKLMENFEYVLDQIGETPLQNLIIATGQTYNKLNAGQIITAVVQLAMAGLYFTDTSTATNTLILTPSVSSYSNPAAYVNNMEFLFSPAHTNTAGVTILFDGMDTEAYTKPLLDKAGNVLAASAIIVNNTYCAYFDSARDAFILGSLRSSSSGQYSDSAMAFIEDIVTSLGITFSDTNIGQLSKAVAEYSLLSSYRDVSTTADLNNQIFRVQPFNEEGTSTVSLAYPFEYYNGMTLRFNPASTNTSSTPSLVIDTLDAVPLRNIDGSSLSAGDIRQGIDIVVRYFNGIFYLLSNKLNKLSLYSGATIDTIENTLSSSATSIPTSLAVNTVIGAINRDIANTSSALKNSKVFCVVNGPSGNDSQTYITLSDTVVAMDSGVGLVFADHTFEQTDSFLSVNISGITGDFKIIYTKGAGLSCIEAAHYTESFDLPSSSATDGDAYVYINPYGKIRTYIYNGILSSWVETQFVKVAFGTESSGSYTLNVPPLCGRYIVESSSVPSSSSSTVITHNMDSLCKAKVLLVCTSSDLAFVAGDTVELSSFASASDFLTIGNTNTSTVISTSGILLPNSLGTPTAITASNWKVVLDITRMF